MNKRTPIFVKLTERGAKYRMTNGVKGSLYEVSGATRTASGLGLNIHVIAERYPRDFKNARICILGPNGDYELTKPGDYDRLMEIALKYEDNLVRNFYANETLNAAHYDDRDPTEFERQTKQDYE